jgi:hypothetical protein
MIQRLRHKGEIIGYRRTIGKMVFYSRDLYGWNGAPIEFDTTENSTEYKDINARLIFENDVLNIRQKSSGREAVYVIKIKNDTCRLIHYNEETDADISALQSSDYAVKIVGFLEQ